MRIGIIETGIPPQKIGGAEKQAWNLARKLAVDHDVTIYTGLYGDTPERETKDGVRICRIGKYPKPFGIASYIVKMVRAIVTEPARPEVLICFRAWPNGAVGYIAHRLFSIPGCFSIRGGDWYFVHGKWWGNLLFRLLESSGMVCVVQSEKIRLEVQAKYQRQPLLIIPNGIDIPEDSVNRGRDVVFVGNLLPRKGVRYLIQAMHGVRNCKLTIVGDGPERKELEMLTEGEAVDFLGRVDPSEVQDLLKSKARVVVLPAVEGEGLPNVLMESMALGIPVIASDVAGISDLLGKGEYGVVVPAGDVKALNIAVSQILSDDVYHSSLGTAGREAIKNYDWLKVSKEWEMLASRLICGDTSFSGVKGDDTRR